MNQNSVDPSLAFLADEPPRGDGRPDWIVPAIVGSALLLQSLESTIISNALPSMARAFHEEPLRLNMAITMFLLASAVFLPISGWVADKFGAKRIFIASMLLFAVSSAGCGFAQNLPQLILARVLQGAAAAMMAPVGRLLLLRTTPKHQLVSALSVYTMPALVAPVLGPVLGGFIVTYLDWRWIFFINLPVAIVGVGLVRAYVPDIAESEVSPLDWTGVFLTGVGLAGLVFGLENLGKAFLPGWQVLGLFVVSLGSLTIYWRHARGNPHAIVDLSVFRIQSFNAGVVGGAFTRMAVGATPFLLAMLLQVGFGMSAFTAGVMIFLSGAGALIMKTAAPPILRRFGFRRVVLINGVVCAASYLIYVLLNPGMPHWLIMALLSVGGFLRSLQFTALNSLTFADIEHRQMSRAATVASMGQQLAQVIGVGFAALLLHQIQQMRGDTQLVWQDVIPVFAAIAFASLISVAWYVRLPQNAGDALSGRAAA
jgi:EmrB/QacA subfamily drug resistance transporter